MGSPIILASGSYARQNMLKNAAVDFETVPADIDEKSITDSLKKDNASSSHIALTLARAKAKKISDDNAGKYVIGSDQVLSMNDEIFSKADSISMAKERLMNFQGKEHFLTSAVCVFKDGEDLWYKTDVAALKMKAMDGQTIDKYIEIAGDTLTQCVGCYALEGAGIRLFDDVRGDFFTVLGMPLLPLIKFLDREGAL
jgi:septum formation protein